MDVKTLCLGALSFGEATGYDIKKFFECTFSYFFVASYGSIYPALADLTEKGWVACHCEAQDGKPDKKVYALTDTGRAAFAQELGRTPPNHKIRSEFLVLMYFAHLLPKDKIADLVDQRVTEFERALEHIREFEQRHGGDECSSPPPGARICCGYGKAVTIAAREYLLNQRAAIVQLGTDGADSRNWD